VNLPMLAEHGMIDARDLTLFDMVDTPEEAWASLVRRGLEAAPLPAAPEPPPAPRRRRKGTEQMKPPG
jgi:hypothetical protein